MSETNVFMTVSIAFLPAGLLQHGMTGAWQDETARLACAGSKQRSTLGRRWAELRATMSRDLASRDALPNRRLGRAWKCCSRAREKQASDQSCITRGMAPRMAIADARREAGHPNGSE
jgi:hypothetical protein